MYPVSDAFLQAVQLNTRKYYWTGRITTVSGDVYEFGYDDILKGSGYITRQCCGSTEIEIGTVFAAEFGITLLMEVDRYSLEGAKVEVFFKIQLEELSWEEIPMGIFEVSEANRGIKTIQLVAYDYMLRFEKNVSSDSSSGTPYDFLSYACEKCKVELAHTREEVEEMPNGTELLGIYPDGNIETYRDLLHYTAQVLGRVCQINRLGQLELIPYGITPVVEVGIRHRFTSTYSDFKTRYTAVSSTNEIEAIAEYYALDPDDGLTMNLEINPLLQYGFSTTREDIIRNILDSISVINYVPFDSETIGNPALDPMDVVKFSGGHADESAVSCITSIQYKINGKHKIKGVGKNPLLSVAKSKADKNIIGLLNQVESNKYVVCSYENAEVLQVDDGGDEIRIINIVFASVEQTSAVFMGNVCMDVSVQRTEQTKEIEVVHNQPVWESIVARAVAEAKEELMNEEETPDYEIPEIEFEDVVSQVVVPDTFISEPGACFRYKIDDLWVEEYTPKVNLVEGKNIVPLLYTMTTLSANSAKKIEVYMSITGGDAVIEKGYCRASVSGSGIAGGAVEWDGTIVCEERVEMLSLVPYPFNVFEPGEELVMAVMDETNYYHSDKVGTFWLSGNINWTGFVDSVQFSE